MGQITATVDRAYCLTSNHVHEEEYDGVMIDEEGLAPGPDVLVEMKAS